MFEQLGLIGCGLMGGSFALALKQAGLVQRVVGYSKSPSTTDRARQLGVIDVEAPSALLAVAGADRQVRGVGIGHALQQPAADGAGGVRRAGSDRLARHGIEAVHARAYGRNGDLDARRRCRGDAPQAFISPGAAP